MTEIAQLIETALRQNRANFLRQAAIKTVAKMPATTTLRELLESEAGASIRELTIDEFRQALSSVPGARPRVQIVALSAAGGQGVESREAKLYRDILVAVEDSPLTIGQLAKQVAVDVTELRGYLAWMKKMGKIASSGRARATRYHVPH